MEEDLDNRFQFHPATTESKQAIHEAVRELYHDVATWAIANIQTSRELSTALTKLEESMFWMNAGVARFDEETGERC